MQKNKAKIIVGFISSALIALGLNASAAVKKPIANAEAVDGLFSAAKESFEAKNNDKSSSSIAKVAGLLNEQAKASTAPKYGKPLTKQATKLTNLATNVKAGKVTKGTVLDQAFARTHSVLSTYFQGRTKRSLAEKTKDTAASAMSATANHIEATAKWSGQKLSDGGKKTVSLLRKSSETIVDGTGKVVEKTGDTLNDGLELITKLGGKIKDGAKKGGNKVKELGGKVKGDNKAQ